MEVHKKGKQDDVDPVPGPDDFAFHSQVQLPDTW